MLTKTRHNKKRNTAFLYEALVRELTKCIVAKDEDRKGIIVSLVREHFGKDTLLRKELDLYKALYETHNLEEAVCDKLIQEVKKTHGGLDREAVFKEQTALINKINTTLSKGVFGNFVPNYKDLATISQILNPDVSVKHRVLLEGALIKNISAIATQEQEPMAPIDNLVYKTFVKKFNDQYNGKLLEEQQRLLSKYIASFHDDGIDLKIFLNEEVCRLKNVVRSSLDNDEIAANTTLCENANRVLNLLEGYKSVEIDQDMVQQILKIQNVAKELVD